MDRVYLINQLNSDLYDGGLLQQQYALRKRVCIDWRKWQGRSVWADCEYDEYDTPAANYFVWLDDQGVARGMMRAIPTTLPYMQSDLWPDMVNGHDLPSSPHVWEISRVCFEAPVLGRRDMVRVMQLVMAAIEEWGAMTGVSELWWMTYAKFAMICPGGHNVEWLGPETVVDGEVCRAGRSFTRGLVPDTKRAQFGISGGVLDWRLPDQLKEAA